ncbi:MAG TPA: fibronectin type III domain-containing protein [Candidatus Polarisedimenticolaceae bacterium]|nr:fibronectin type III domain-containing protein [Candidatus Polarisedimenticolaceae bacterium]
MMTAPKRATLVCLAGGLLLAALPAAGRPRVEFETEGPIITTEGHATLRWAAVDPVERGSVFELQDSTDPEFRSTHVWYRGPDRASFVSGLPEGTSWFRVRAVRGQRAGPWSDPVAIEVDYASSSTLGRLLALGAVVFLATLVTVVVGHRRREAGG